MFNAQGCNFIAPGGLGKSHPYGNGEILEMRIASIFLALFIILDGALIYNSQKKIETLGSGPSGTQSLPNIPDSKYLKQISLGQNSLLADLIWLKTIQVMGDRNITRKDAEWIYHAVSTATDLDPKFYYMTELGGIYLAAVAGHHNLSIKLLKKGYENNPGLWEFPFFIGFNYFFYLKDFKQAAYYMGVGAELPKRPPYLPFLASRLYAQAGDPRYGMELTEAIYENTKNEKVREALRQRMKELQVEINLDALQNEVNAYKSRFGRYPASVRELLAGGFIKTAPVDSLGVKYLINPETGEVSNTRMARRLRIYRKGVIYPKGKER